MDLQTALGYAAELSADDVDDTPREGHMSEVIRTLAAALDVELAPSVEQVLAEGRAELAELRAIRAAADDWATSAARRLDYLQPTERELYRVMRPSS